MSPPTAVASASAASLPERTRTACEQLLDRPPSPPARGRPTRPATPRPRRRRSPSSSRSTCCSDGQGGEDLDRRGHRRGARRRRAAARHLARRGFDQQADGRCDRPGAVRPAAGRRRRRPPAPGAVELGRGRCRGRRPAATRHEAPGPRGRGRRDRRRHGRSRDAQLRREQRLVQPPARRPRGARPARSPARRESGLRWRSSRRVSCSASAASRSANWRYIRRWRTSRPGVEQRARRAWPTMQVVAVVGGPVARAARGRAARGPAARSGRSRRRARAASAARRCAGPEQRSRVGVGGRSAGSVGAGAAPPSTDGLGERSPAAGPASIRASSSLMTFSGR